MTIINLSGVGANPGISLYRDIALSSQVEPIEFLTPTATKFAISLILGIRVDSVYELQTGVWTLRTDARISGNYVLLDSIPTGLIAVVPKSYASLVQQSGKSSLPIKLYTKLSPALTAKNFTVTTLDDETAAVGPVVFSLTEAGVYTDTLGPIDLPASFWIKSVATTVKTVKTIPIVITSDIYL